MHKRLLAITAMIALTFAFGVGSALAAKGGEPGPPEKADPPPCSPDSDNPKGCEGNPGNGGGEDPPPPPPPGGSQCDELPELGEATIDGTLTTVCEEIVGLLEGGGGGEPAPPTCADAPAELQEPCETITEGGGGEPAPPTCADAPAELQQGCEDLQGAVEDALGNLPA